MARILCNVAGGGKPLKGNAEPGDVLAGKTFSNKQSNALTGSMPNNGTNKNAVSVGGGSGSLWAYMPYGYYDNYNNSGNAWINITDDQAKTLANNAGVGYNSGYANGNSVKPSNMIIGAAVTSKKQGFIGTCGTFGKGCTAGAMQINIEQGYYYHVQLFNGNENSKSWVTNQSGYANSALTFRITDGNDVPSVGLAITSNYPIF